MRVSSLLALFLSSVLLAGCVGLGEETGAVAPGRASAGAAKAAPAPIGLWRGGLTMLVMTTRDRQGNPLRDPWFGSNRASDPTAAKAILYPPSKSMLASVNPIASTDWTVAGADVLAGATPAQGLALQAEGRDVLVYVHGFHETFETSATSYAKLVSGIGFTGAPVLFTWPSRGALLDYVTDKESAMWSRDALEDTLTALATNPRVGRIHLLAHSMGGILALEVAAFHRRSQRRVAVDPVRGHRARQS